jgi:hypothetical protein
MGTETILGFGATNTDYIMAGCTERPIAASVCADLVLNGFSDWYLPSISELQLMYSRLHLQGLGGFDNGFSMYWSSSQYDPTSAWSMMFFNGGIYARDKGTIDDRVRAVRSFNIPSVPTVLTASVSAVSSNSATTGGNVTSDGGAAVTACGVAYGTTASPTTAGVITNSGTGTGAFTSQLTGLTASMTYYVRAYATNSVGTAYGNEETFSTTASPPSVLATVTTTAVSSLTSSSATTGGNVTLDGGAAVTGRGVAYGTTAGPTIAGTITSDGTGTGAFTSQLNGLTSSTQYYVRTYATNSVGTAYGNEVDFTTNAPPLAIGMSFAGGIIFHLDNTGEHGLVCAPSDQGNFQWGCYGINILNHIGMGTETILGFGATNTDYIMAGCTERPIAASVCADLVLNGFSDWYLPSISELQLMYSRLHLQGLGGFDNGYSFYWSSSQSNEFSAWSMMFTNGGIYARDKGNYAQVRAVRTF